MRNLLYAISASGDKQIEPFIFFGTQVDKKTINSFQPFAKVITTKTLDRKSIPWFISKVFIRFFGSMFFVKRLLSQHGISIISHADSVYGNLAPLKVISWIPDFQYLHLPELFPNLDIEAETRYLQKVIMGSDLVVLSSNAAYQDFLRIAPIDFATRGRVLQFVSQPDSKLVSNNVGMDLLRVMEKYDFSGKFFFLPNQFWEHKNHATVFEAVRILTAKGIDVLVICTGNLQDYRKKNNELINSLNQFIKDNNLQKNIKILGLIDYDDVLCLMKNCLAVLNPSYFEGWSSSVEEAKSIGKHVVLSNIPVHVEQAPTGGKYFPAGDAFKLSLIMEEHWICHEKTSSQDYEEKAVRQLHERTLAFGRNYIRLVRELI